MIRLMNVPTDALRHKELLREAIRTRAFVRANATQPIIEKNGTGLRGWIFDFRALMLDSRYLDAYTELFWEQYGEFFPFQICGVELTGVPLVAAIVMKGRERGYDVNGLFVRKSRKKDGLTKVVEGAPRNVPVIFVDDLINSGQSLERGIAQARAEGLTVAHAFVILSFHKRSAYASFSQNNKITLASLFTIKELGLPEVREIPEQPTHSFEMLWKFAAPNPGLHYVVPKSAPVITDSHVFMGSDNGTMYALHQKNGSVAWTYRVGRIPFRKGIFSTPVRHEGVLYFGAYDGNFYALEENTGKRHWVYRDADWIGSSPALAPDLDLVYIGLEFGLFKKHGGIVALSLKTGAEMWVQRDVSGFTHASPLYSARERAVYIGNNNGGMYCYNARSGTLRWRFATQGGIKARAVYDETRRLIVFGSLDGTIYAIHAKTGQVIWTHTCSEGVISIPFVHENTVFISCLDKCIYALSLEDGSRRWRFATSGRIFASPVIADGSLWIGSNDGALYELDPLSGTLRSRFQTTERIVNAIAYDSATRSLFVPTQANELYCIRKQQN